MDLKLELGPPLSADRTEWAVYADALIDQGDPRGERLAEVLALTVDDVDAVWIGAAEVSLSASASASRCAAEGRRQFDQWIESTGGEPLSFVNRYYVIGSWPMEWAFDRLGRYVGWVDARDSGHINRPYIALPPSKKDRGPYV